MRGVLYMNWHLTVTSNLKDEITNRNTEYAKNNNLLQ